MWPKWCWEGWGEPKGLPKSPEMWRRLSMWTGPWHNSTQITYSTASWHWWQWEWSCISTPAASTPSSLQLWRSWLYYRRTKDPRCPWKQPWHCRTFAHKKDKQKQWRASRVLGDSYSLHQTGKENCHSVHLTHVWGPWRTLTRAYFLTQPCWADSWQIELHREDWKLSWVSITSGLVDTKLIIKSIKTLSTSSPRKFSFAVFYFI